MDGWISISRKIQNKSWYKDSERLHIWIHLLLNANHKDKKIWINGEELLIKRGQLLTSRKSISENIFVNESKIYRSLKFFEKEHQIEQQKTNKFTLITIVNYDNYQKSEQQNEQSSEQQMNNKRTTNEQQMNTNNNDNNVNNNITTTNIYAFVEENFGRTLSPIEYEEIFNWEDNELTRYAIKQSVLNNKFSIKYISRIIDSYKSENIRTVQEAQEREKKFNQIKNYKEEKKYISSHERWEETKRKFLEEGEDE